jgi:peptide/nickel transport system substrate-binding protein/oligopeptide transport system substrate-binding protein
MQSGKKHSAAFPSALFCVFAMLLLVACGGNAGPSSGAPASGTPVKASADKQVLRYPVIGDVSTVDPAKDSDTDSDFIIQAAYVGLVGLDDNLKVKLNLASTYNVSPDGMTYTFTLRPNLKFADGTPLTANDVAYSINRTVLPSTKSTVSYYLSLIKGFDKVSAAKQSTLIGDGLIVKDPNTIAINLTQKAPYFLQTLAYPTSFVLEKSMVEKYTAADGSTTFTDHLNDGGTTGPFKVVSYSHTTGVEMVSNENYYGPKPALQHLSILFYKDYNGTYQAYQANQVDFTQLPSANVAGERNSPGFRETPRLTERYLAMNYLDKPFDNLKVRQAFALAINKDSIVQGPMRGTFTATNHVIPSGMPGYYPDLKGVDGAAATKGNPDLAKQLLQQGLQEDGFASVAALPPITLTYYPEARISKMLRLL